MNPIAKIFLTLLFVSSFGFSTQSQTAFDIQVLEETLPNLPPIHSGVSIRYQGYWVYIGGRTNGLHGFQTGSGFPSLGANKSVVVYNPSTYSSSSILLNALPDSMRDFLSSSNQQFDVEGDKLYIAGGYGYSSVAQNFITFPNLARIDLPMLIDFVLTGQISLLPCIEMIRYNKAAVTGGHMKSRNHDLFLFCGHKFDGMYSVNDTAGFFQQGYTTNIKAFHVTEPTAPFGVDSVTARIDTVRLRRRDFNLSPFYFSSGSFGYLITGGGFTKITNNLIHTGVYYLPNSFHGSLNGFSSDFNLYHCATLPIYDSVADIMHSVYFGGISDHYRAPNGGIVEDSLAPFVKTISRITRFAGSIQEYLFDSELPSYLGSNAVFMATDTARFDRDGIFRMPEVIPPDYFIDLGYLVSGIESPLPHISLTDPSVSVASGRAFKVRMNFNVINKTNQTLSEAPLSIFPTETAGVYRVQTSGNGSTVAVYDMGGQEVQRLQFMLSNQQNTNLDLRAFGPGCYVVRYTTPAAAHAVKLMYTKP
jgi:hypothetical protein